MYIMSSEYYEVCVDFVVLNVAYSRPFYRMNHGVWIFSLFRAPPTNRTNTTSSRRPSQWSAVVHFSGARLAMPKSARRYY